LHGRPSLSFWLERILWPIVANRRVVVYRSTGKMRRRGRPAVRLSAARSSPARSSQRRLARPAGIVYRRGSTRFATDLHPSRRRPPGPVAVPDMRLGAGGIDHGNRFGTRRLG